MFHTPVATIEPIKIESKRPLRIAILGATGSIGTQTIDLVSRHPDLFQVVALTVNTRIEEAVLACHKVRPRVLVVCDKTKAAEAKQKLSSSLPEIKVLSGNEAMCEVVNREDVDLVVTATVGYSGLLPTLEAITSHKDIALANKETLVVAGDYIRKSLKDSRTRIFPIDSEHSAIAQCLKGEELRSVNKLIITASGGPFRNWSKKQLESASAQDALRHPNWDMGAKITIDSASMMNKAFEIVEAHYLFGISPENIEAVVHPQSIIHSMVEFKDGAIKAQLGVPDMHLPIAYALGLNNRIAHSSPRLTIDDISKLTFEKPDLKKFPCLGFAQLILERRGNTACVVNAANEIAVDAFLKSKIKFTDIPSVIEGTIEKVSFIENPDINDFIETNCESSNIARDLINQM